mmetsp:Transcript_1901/g.4200  ORF Transcript_1901/g.4200 Transcript_1901/m.4200 type:complete len:288 (-) Transcript_1901:1121-1984(-)
MVSHSIQHRYEKLLAKQPSQSGRRRSSVGLLKHNASTDKLNATSELRLSYAELHKSAKHSKRVSFGSSYDSRVDEFAATQRESLIKQFHPAFKPSRKKIDPETKFKMSTPTFAASNLANYPSFMANTDDRLDVDELSTSRQPTKRQYELTPKILDCSIISKGKQTVTDQTRLYDELVQLDTMINEEIEFHHQVNSQPIKPYEASPIKVDLMASYQQAMTEIEALKQQIACLDEKELEYRKMNQKLLENIELQEEQNIKLRQSLKQSKDYSPSRPVSLKMCPPIRQKL